MSKLELLNADDKPYGPLTNDAYVPLKIDDKNWDSVTQYVYTNMISPSSIYHNKLKRSYRINSDFNKFKTEIDNEIIKKSLEEALIVKFENPTILNILLSTGEANLVYITPNELFGNGRDGKGLNLVGKYMEQIRNEILNKQSIEKKQIEFEDNIYHAYIALTILKKEKGLTIKKVRI